MDNVSREKRSLIMGAVKSKRTKMELAARKTLAGSGLRPRYNAANYPGKPDIAFKKAKLVIFLDSCFWHGCPRHCRMPKANAVYWKNKIIGNKKRDRTVNKIYKKKGWKAVRIWEHQLNKNPGLVLKTLTRSVK